MVMMGIGICMEEDRENISLWRQDQLDSTQTIGAHRERVKEGSHSRGINILPKKLFSCQCAIFNLTLVYDSEYLAPMSNDQIERKEKDMLEAAQYYTRDYWFNGQGHEAMIAEFSANPSVMESVKEGLSLEGSIDDLMSSCFASVAWNYKIDPKDLYQKVLDHIFN
jgi:hypothetical protein